MQLFGGPWGGQVCCREVHLQQKQQSKEGIQEMQHIAGEEGVEENH